MDQTGEEGEAALANTERVENLLRARLRVERKDRAVTMGASRSCCAVQCAVHIDQPGEGHSAGRAIQLTAKGIKHLLGASARIDRERNTAPIAPAVSAAAI